MKSGCGHLDLYADQVGKGKSLFATLGTLMYVTSG